MEDKIIGILQSHENHLQDISNKVVNFNDKIMVFIDGMNLFTSAKEKNIQYNVMSLIKEVTGPRNFRRAYYYTSVDPSNNGEQRFLKALSNEGVEIRKRELRIINNDKEKNVKYEKGIDILVAVDMLTLARNRAFDTGILISGDEDFCELVEAVKRLGPRVEVASFAHSFSKKLKECADGIIYLDDIQDKILK